MAPEGGYKALAGSIDDFVSDNIPGGWTLPLVLAAAYATGGASLAAEAAAAGEAEGLGAALNAAGGEIVRDGRVLGQPGSHRGKFVAHALRRDVRIWIFLRHLDQQVDIENARIEEVGHAVPVALFPMLEDRIVERAGPAHATFEELKSGSIVVNERTAQTVPVTSYTMSLEIAEKLKKWIEEGKFFLTEPQDKIPSV